MDKDITDFINLWVGKRLENINNICEMLDICFSDNLVLHGMGLTRVFLNDDLLITTIDYNSWDESESRHNDEWYNTYRYKSQVIGGKVTNISINKFNDLFLELDNGVRIECYIANAYPHYNEECEQWVLFEHTQDHSGRFLTAYNKGISFD
ncbi:MAG: hypothetical protein IJJ74_09585 [Eubacterium sp.]|nr:hypothetical protein [Eubacterium sp.]MBR1673784.1 hypothetical protein [Eubacterium sp.]